MVIENFQSLTSEELSYLKTSNNDSNYDSPLVALFDVNIFPYYANKGDSKKQVHFFLGYHFSVFNKGKHNAVRVSHRNRSGVLEVENSYWGPKPDNKNYGLIIRIRPDFTNEMYVSGPRVYPKTITDFNTNMLDQLAKQIIDVWDKAIENNARMWG